MSQSAETERCSTDEAYEQILLSIDPQYADRAYIVLQWLAFGNDPVLNGTPEYSRHPLTLAQIIEAASIGLRPQDLPNREESESFCENLLVKGTGLLKLEDFPRNQHCSDKETVIRIAFTNESVKEYLLGDCILSGPAKLYHTNGASAHETIAKGCLRYLLHIVHLEKKARDLKQEYPLATYAALFWIDFVNQDSSPSTWELIEALFSAPVDAFDNWLGLLNEADNHYLNVKGHSHILRLNGSGAQGYGCLAPPIVWASAMGLRSIVEMLIRKGYDVNAVGSAHVPSLCIAVEENHRDVVELLLENGGDVAADYVEDITSWDRGQLSRSPLYWASKCNMPDMLELLLRDRSRYGRAGWKLENCLGLAADQNSKECAQLLIAAGADVDAIDIDIETTSSVLPIGGCALQIAAWHKSTDVLNLLLAAGANVDTRGGTFETALQAAAERGRDEIISLLLSAGVDTSIVGGRFGTPLIAACWKGHIKVIKSLLNAGCDPNIDWDLSSLILGLNFKTYDEKRATTTTNTSTAEVLEEKYPYGLDPSPEARRPTKEESENPGLESALRKRLHNWMLSHSELVKKSYGFYPTSIAFPKDTLGQIRRSAMRIASRLREAGVQKEGEGEGRYMFNAIQAAVANERPDIVELLLEKGAMMPLVLAVADEVVAEEEEGIARKMRSKSSFCYQTRGGDGTVGMSGSQALP